jgi:hypothetical protein
LVAGLMDGTHFVIDTKANQGMSIIIIIICSLYIYTSSDPTFKRPFKICCCS